MWTHHECDVSRLAHGLRSATFDFRAIACLFRFAVGGARSASGHAPPPKIGRERDKTRDECNGRETTNQSVERVLLMLGSRTPGCGWLVRMSIFGFSRHGGSKFDMWHQARSTGSSLFHDLAASRKKTASSQQEMEGIRISVCIRPCGWQASHRRDIGLRC